MNKNQVGGFEFDSENDASLATQESKKVTYLEEHLDYTDTQTLLQVYQKAIETRAFQTPIGHGFLLKIRNSLLEQGVAEESLPTIPLFVSYTRKVRDASSPVKTRIKTTEKQEKINGFQLSIILNVLLIGLVIAMFVITLNSDNPNILNYENVLLNKYASWEQDLSDREAAVREKELELDLNNQ